VSATRIYANRGLARRTNGSLVVVIIAFVFGFFEIWRAMHVGPEEPGSGYLFAILFLGGGVYAGRQLLSGTIDAVVWLDLDASRQATVALWRPFTTKRIAGPVDRLTGWRPYAKEVRRNMKQPMVLADHPDYPRPLEFEIGPGVVLGEEFRALAGAAVASLEKKGPAAGGR
jgi:hypothetical protein